MSIVKSQPGIRAWPGAGPYKPQRFVGPGQGVGDNATKAWMLSGTATDVFTVGKANMTVLAFALVGGNPVLMGSTTTDSSGNWTIQVPNNLVGYSYFAVSYNPSVPTTAGVTAFNLTAV
jgi:hypothetical protein